MLNIDKWVKLSKKRRIQKLFAKQAIGIRSEQEAWNNLSWLSLHQIHLGKKAIMIGYVS